MDEITRLVALLGHGDAADDEEALALLAIHGRRAVESLLTAAADPEPERRSACLTALGRIGDQRARRTVALALADRSATVRAAAATAVASFPTAEAVSRLAGLLKREKDPDVRLRSAASLVDMFNVGMVEALDPLLSIVSDRAEDRRVRLEALKVLSMIPASEARAVVTALAADPDPRVARAAASCAGDTARDRAGTREALADLGSTDYFTFREAAGRLAATGEPALPELVAALRDRAGDPAACSRVASVLREISRGRERAVARYLDETDETLPLALLVDIVGESADRTALYHLKGVIDRLDAEPGDPDPARGLIAAKAHYYLARAGSRVAFDSLKRALARRDGGLMGEVLMAVEEIGGRDELLDLLAHYRREQGWMRDRIAQSFRRVMKRARVRPEDPLFDRLDDARRESLRELLSDAARGTIPARRSSTGSAKGTTRGDGGSLVDTG